MDLVNIVYRYVNRFINSKELLALLENVDKSKFSKKENEKIDKLINETKVIIETVPIKLDEVEKNRIATIDHMVEFFEKILDNDKLDEKEFEIINKQYNQLLKDRKKVKDSGPRYEKLFELLTNFSVYIKYCLKMDDYELIKFITQYISVPLPPKITQKDFDDLVAVAIEKDERESLWRLALNYNRKGKDFTLIENYFIDKRDGYYLTELISAIKEDLNMEELIEKVINTNDTSFIIDCGKRAKNIGIFTDKEIEKLKERKNQGWKIVKKLIKLVDEK